MRGFDQLAVNGFVVLLRFLHDAGLAVGDVVIAEGGFADS
ncbi:hypothetical protein C791_3992 [Amycolatopsis azurea DSM 43854]|uniref:Uncharacterized protein n=1 Tax=Amycolatopsis azurea DSM 43854 TaxID=1238180 RepID=M2Q263_9PSEU|nr:hypothetical protein C791_3992 [Amycolatopsis azurea DSM 43854]